MAPGAVTSEVIARSGASASATRARRLDGVGDGVWTKRFGGYASQYGGDMALDGAGNLLMVGRFKGEVDVGGGELQSSSTTTDIYVAKLSADGDHLFSHDDGVNGSNEHARGVAPDSDGYTFVIGTFEAGVDFGDGPLVSAGSADIFLARQMV